MTDWLRPWVGRSGTGLVCCAFWATSGQDGLCHSSRPPIRAEVLGPEWRSGRVTARALPVTRGILHRRFEDALSEADSRTISVAFLDSAAKTPGILHRHIEVAAAARRHRGYRTVGAPRERRVCAIAATPLPSFMWRAMSVA